MISASDSATSARRRAALRCSAAAVGLWLWGCSADTILTTTVLREQTGGTTGAGTGGSPASPIDLEVLDNPLEPGALPATDIVVEVRSDVPTRHPISPLVYGLRASTNANDPGALRPCTDDFEVYRPLLCSLANMRWSTYNWENNASNSGYQFNVNDSGLSSSEVPGDAVKTRLDATPRGVRSVVVIPIGGRVAADKLGTNVLGDPGYLTTRFVENLHAKPTALSLQPDPNDGAVYQDEFANWLRAEYPSDPPLFALDEEPDLWSASSIPAARPEQLTYAELVRRNLDFARAVKNSWPEAEVLGLTSYGWSGWASLSTANSGPADDAQGEFLDYYLESLNTAAQTDGRRLIDMVDLHWFSEVYGPASDGTSVRVVSVSNGSASEARIQAPRSLWDPSYSEDSWIVNDVLHEPIRLIPRMLAKIQQLYPGTGLAIGSWLFGGEAHISGAIAVSDTLGILGREGVAMAALARATDLALTGFRVFTNYDGQGSRFGDFSIGATTNDAEASSAYASVDTSNPDRTTVVVINKQQTSASVGLRIAHPRAYSNAEYYQLDSETETITALNPLTSQGQNGFVWQMPGWSIAIVVPKE